jgi:hypothetical protein
MCPLSKRVFRGLKLVCLPALKFEPVFGGMSKEEYQELRKSIGL